MKRDPNHILAAVLILGAIVIVTIAGGIVVLRRETPRATSSFASQTAGKRSESHYFNIGLEDWQLGSASYVMHIAQPKPVGITGIQGFASAGPLPGANLNSGLVRQTLVSLIYPGAPQPHVTFTSLPSFQRKEYSVSPDLFDLNIKQINAQTEEIPIQVSFPTPIRLPNNTLIVHFVNETYKVGGTESSAVQCLDVELHLLVTYRL